MIIIKVQGGLGNQLLQYSIGYVIAHEYNKEVAYDLSFFNQDTKYTKRPYLLDTFNLEVRVATEEEIFKTRYPYGHVSKVISLITRGLNKYFFKKYNIAYNENFFLNVKKSDSLYLEGFWQGYKYYEHSLDALSKCITLKDSTHLEEVKRTLSFADTVSASVHIRRGDLLNKGAGTQAVQKEYYEQVIPLFEQKVPSPMYYVFSDDIEWVRETLGHLFKKVIYVSGASGLNLTDCEEFMLMKDCTHAIISNSTFSWFATLLTNNPQKVVFHPTDWKNEYLNRSKEICPREWNGL